MARILAVLCVFVGLFGSSLLPAETPPPNCQPTSPYKFILQGSVNGGSSWTGSAIWIDARPSEQIRIPARTLMTVTPTGEIEGWSFGVQHTVSSSFTSAGGTLTATTPTITGTNAATVQGGSAPDVNGTFLVTGGYVSGIAIDTDSSSTNLNAPVTGFVTSTACYVFNMPATPGIYSGTLTFTHNIGSPSIRCTISQGGQSLTVCKLDLALTISVSATAVSTPSGCSGGSGLGPQGGGFEGGGFEPLAPLIPGAPGTDFRRGDADDNGVVNITDGVFALNALFLGGPQPTCLDAADANDDEKFEVTDGINILNFLFLDADTPPTPDPDICGPDIKDITSGTFGLLRLDCQTYMNCPGLDSDPEQEDSDGDGLTDFYETNFRLDDNVIIPDLNPNDSDSDDDFFTDGQEVLPILVPGCSPEAGFKISMSPQQFPGNLSAGIRRANPFVKDVFVEVDFLRVAGSHNHRPIYTTLSFIRDQFIRGGIPGGNPDILFNLHFDIGPVPSGFNADLTIFDYGNAKNEIAENATNATMDMAEMINTIKPTFFDSKNRCNVFHYGVFGHSHTGNTATTTVFGEGEITGDDWVLTLNTLTQNSFSEKITLMHELGHNFGLRHGGFEGDGNFKAGFNNKPNYNSIMCNLYNFFGRDTDGDAEPDTGPDTNRIDYSHEVLPTLNESMLVESAGVNGTPIDWNCDNDEKDTVSRDIQCREFRVEPACKCTGSINTFSGHDDWKNVKLFMNKTSGGGGSAPESVLCIE